MENRRNRVKNELWDSKTGCEGFKTRCQGSKTRCQLLELVLVTWHGNQVSKKSCVAQKRVRVSKNRVPAAGAGVGDVAWKTKGLWGSKTGYEDLKMGWGEGRGCGGHVIVIISKKNQANARAFRLAYSEL